MTRTSIARLARHPALFRFAAAVTLVAGMATTSNAALVASWSSGLDNDYTYTVSGTTSTLTTSPAGGINGFLIFGPAVALNPPGTGSNGTPIAVTITVTATSMATATSVGGLDSQGGFSGTFTFTQRGAGGPYAAGTILETIAFTNAVLSGTDGGSTVSLAGSTAAGQGVVIAVPVSSTVLTNPEDFHLELVNLRDSAGNLEALSIAANNRFTPFLGSDTGSSSAITTAVPEPTAIVLAFSGLPALGLLWARRRQRA